MCGESDGRSTSSGPPDHYTRFEEQFYMSRRRPILIATKHIPFRGQDTSGQFFDLSPIRSANSPKFQFVPSVDSLTCRNSRFPFKNSDLVPNGAKIRFVLHGSSPRRGRDSARGFNPGFNPGNHPPVATRPEAEAAPDRA
jgi:hypothetical protein